MKRNHMLLVLFTLVLAASLFYVVYYQLILKDIARQTYNGAYYIAYSLDAYPALYCSFGVVLGMLVQLWAEKPIGRRVRTPCAVIGCGLLLLYTGSRIAYWLYYGSVLPYYPFSMRFSMLLLAHPILFLILGLVLSVGITIDVGVKGSPGAGADPVGASG